MPIQIYLVEDHPDVQRITSEFINLLPGLIMCGVASSGQTALAQIPQLQPDLAIVDLSLPDVSGLTLVNQLHLQNPALLLIIYSTHRETPLIRRALAVGTKGYLIKGNPAEIEPAIQTVLAGEIYLSPQIRQPL